MAEKVTIAKIEVRNERADINGAPDEINLYGHISDERMLKRSQRNG